MYGTMLVMPKTETFYERFGRLLDEAGVSDAGAAELLGVSQDIVRRLRKGTGSLKLTGGLRLASRLGVSPWYLAMLPEPATPSGAAHARAHGESAPEPVTLEQLRSFQDEYSSRLAKIEIALGIPPPPSQKPDR